MNRIGTFVRVVLVAAPIAFVSIACGTITPPLPTSPDVQALAGQNEAPLIIDWPAGTRGNLEIAMDKGVAVVSFDNKGEI